MADTFDAVVIGGGITGVSTLFHLANQDVKVALIEKSYIAGGPTGQSSAIIRQHYSNPVTIRMALNSLHFWQNFEEVVGGDCGYTRTGFLIAVEPKDVEGLKANIKLQHSLGVDTKFVSPQEMREIEPHLDPDGLGGGAYEPDGGFCDPASAANALAQAARHKGATIRTDEQAMSFLVKAERITGIQTNRGAIHTDNVIIATGPWSNALLKTLGIDVPMITARVSIGLFLRPKLIDSHSVWADFISQIYLRPETGGLMLIGSISPKEADDQVQDPDNYNERVRLEVLADFAERAAIRYPSMKESHLQSSFASLYDITPDWHPIMDRVPGVNGLYLCAGGSGHCFKLGPAIGEMMSNLVIQGSTLEDDIQLFSFSRFDDGKPVTGRYEYSIVG